MKPIRAEPANARDPASCLMPIWPLLVELARWRRDGRLPSQASGFSLSSDGVCVLASGVEQAMLEWQPGHGFRVGRAATAEQGRWLGLYLPILAGGGPDRPMVVGHLGQSLDGKIATANGDSRYVTGPANLAHLHRLRALCDAVVVGAGTAAADNPRLTTRLVDGPNPTRILLDPNGRLRHDLTVFTDGEAPTLRVRALGVARDGDTEHGASNSVAISTRGSGLCLSELMQVLVSRGLIVVFVEGGGITVSRFMEQNHLDRLHVALAPVFIGAGRHGVQVQPALNMQAVLRPPCSIFQMGNDVLWDFDLRQSQAAP